MLTADIESVIHNFLRSKAIGLGGVVYALNGTTDHVHLITSIPPKIAIATFVGQVKGFASAQWNKRYEPETPFYWQTEYGVFSFDQKRLPNFVAYVERQKQHHANNITLAVLEKVDEQGDCAISETGQIYSFEDEEWRRELVDLEGK